MVMSVLTFGFAALSCVCGMFLNLLPVFRGRQLLAKMICSVMFAVTGLLCLLQTGLTAYSGLVFGGLVFGVIGDYLIDCAENRKHLLPAALFFGIGHTLYITAFIAFCTPSLGDYAKYILMLTGVMIVAAILTVKNDQIRFRKGYRIMIVYALVLMVSFIVSFSRGIVAAVNGDTVFGVCLTAASAMFIVSDTFLAVELFGKPRLPFTKHLVNPTYFLAQTGFALSILFY